MLFSGGLDSLGGAVEEVIGRGRKVALVSHRPVGKIDARQRELSDLLGNKAVRRGRPRPFHVPILANKSKHLGREYTQRTRSFLFGAFGVAVARLFGLDGLRFYENGVVSLNLPVCAQVLGGRASRTTHPQTLARLQALFSRVLDRPFRIENPFLWKTKTDVTAGVRAAGLGGLIAHTVSCAHTWETTTEQPHCGECSQCIDRRLAAVAAGLGEAEDPALRYRTQVLTGAFAGVEHQTLVERVVGLAHHIGGMSGPSRLCGEVGEISRVLRYVGGPADAAAQHVYDLYKRHADQVRQAIALVQPSDPSTAARQGNNLIGIATGHQGSSVADANDQPMPFAPTKPDIAILKELDQSVAAVLIFTLAVAAEVSRKTVGERVQVMIRYGLICFPHGSRRGVAITAAGRGLYHRVCGTDESVQSWPNPTRVLATSAG